jgi:hypothetical protein
LPRNSYVPQDAPACPRARWARPTQAPRQRANQEKSSKINRCGVSRRCVRGKIRRHPGSFCLAHSPWPRACEESGGTHRIRLGARSGADGEKRLVSSAYAVV